MSVFVVYCSQHLATAASRDVSALLHDLGDTYVVGDNCWWLHSGATAAEIHGKLWTAFSQGGHWFVAAITGAEFASHMPRPGRHWLEGRL